MALVELGRFYDSIEAGMVRSRLASEGIESVLFDESMSWVGGAIPVRLMVDESDRERAERLLAG